MTELNTHYQRVHSRNVIIGWDKDNRTCQTNSWRTLAQPANLKSPSTNRFHCPHCAYTAKWPTGLRKHLMVHEDSRPFVCAVCLFAYKWTWDLGRHFAKSHPYLLNPYRKRRVRRRNEVHAQPNDNEETTDI
ncbi:unnamed protein product [Dicrocoelium dendriticum]|nr:unnamed protein product [Dicrocoelium dendriticum]